MWQFDFVATHIKLTEQDAPTIDRKISYRALLFFIDVVRKHHPGFEAAAALRAMPNMTSVAFTKVF